jgi:hypothetical protein
MGTVVPDFRLSLCVRHPTLPATTIVEIVRRPARVALSVGENRPRPTRDSPVARMTQTFCKFRLVSLTGESLDQAMMRHAAHLQWDAPELYRVTRTGGDAQLYVSWFVGRSDKCAIAPATLTCLAALGISLALNVYSAAETRVQVERTDPFLGFPA